MAGNSKITYNGETLIDISNDSVTPDTLAQGVTAHDANGDPIVGTMVPGEGGTLEQQQADYEENDTSKVTFIKNRPFYVVSEEVVTVTKEDYQNDPICQATGSYVLGDYVPLRDYTTEVFCTFLNPEGTPMEGLNNVLIGNDVEFQYSEPILKGVFVDNGVLAFVYESGFSYIMNSQIPKAGLWTRGFANALEYLDEGCSLEFTIRKLKRIEPKFTDGSEVKVFTLEDVAFRINESLDVSSLGEDFTYASMSNKPTYLYVYADTINIPIQMINIGFGFYMATILGAIHLYSLSSQDNLLIPHGTVTITLLSDGTESTETTTYSLRQPSLADTINASLEERGLKIDLSNYDGTWLKNEVSQ